MLMTRQMHETTAVFNTHGVVVQRMIDKVMIMAPILIIMMVIMTPILIIIMMIMTPILIIMMIMAPILIVMMVIMTSILIIIKTSKGSRGPSLGTVHEM